MWILLKQETVSGSGVSWAICKSAPRCRLITTPAPHHSVFTGRMPFLSPNQQCQSTEGINPESYIIQILSSFELVKFESSSELKTEASKIRTSFNITSHDKLLL